MDGVEIEYARVQEDTVIDVIIYLLLFSKCICTLFSQRIKSMNSGNCGLHFVTTCL